MLTWNGSHRSMGMNERLDDAWRSSRCTPVLESLRGCIWWRSGGAQVRQPRRETPDRCRVPADRPGILSFEGGIPSEDMSVRTDQDIRAILEKAISSSILERSFEETVLDAAVRIIPPSVFTV